MVRAQWESAIFFERIDRDERLHRIENVLSGHAGAIARLEDAARDLKALNPPSGEAYGMAVRQMGDQDERIRSLDRSISERVRFLVGVPFDEETVIRRCLMTLASLATGYCLPRGVDKDA